MQADTIVDRQTVSQIHAGKLNGWGGIFIIFYYYLFKWIWSVSWGKIATIIFLLLLFK